jgi:c(7)-type cytochrome triheme protein
VVASASAAAEPASPDRPRYGHAKHAQLEVDHRDCKRCHSLDAELSVRPPLTGKDHRPCSDRACHASEFFAVAPTICGVCHDGVEPWKQLEARSRPVAASEFGGDLSHAAHANAVGARGEVNGACVYCHGELYAGRPPADGHGACAPCHGKTAEPSMGTCDGCHRLGAGASEATAPASAWSVAAQFSHRAHGRTPSGEVTPCVRCHTEIAKATTTAAVATPTMQCCEGCHDGKLAFKTTGFQCYRCHGEGGP